ncbi:MAG: class I SAM-dependent methyltransferase, partial [Alphaproteobacteria bacterium]
MSTSPNKDPRRHLGLTEPSPWVVRFADLIAPGGPVLDVACGGGRHTRLFLAHGHPVTAVDIDISVLDAAREQPGLERLQTDMEDGGPFPLAGRLVAGNLVPQYLHRPLFPARNADLEPG